MPIKIASIEHPNYSALQANWETYRLVGTGGEAFLEEYLIKRPRETGEDFSKRKKLTYIPAFAKSALNQIRNSIRQRLTAVQRIGGSEKYTRASKGLDFGVDKKKSSMNKFIGDVVLSELTMMGGVGIYVDAPRSDSVTADQEISHIPYLYLYKIEDIKSWSTDPNDPTRFIRLLLREYVEKVDPDFGIVIGFEERFRLYSLNDTGTVTLQYFDKDSKLTETIDLAIDEIPFVYLQLSDSLLADVARHQIALLNLGSSDVNYIWEGNIVFLAEQYDPNSPEAYYRNTTSDSDGATEGAAETRKIDPGKRFLGVDKGVKVPKGMDYPAYISPDISPLTASMAKQDSLKEQIFEIINQSLKTISSRASSAESKQLDSRREEDGLKAIGDELEHAENKIASLWAKYEGSKVVARINYPANYEFKNDDQRRIEAKELGILMNVTPSKTAQKEICKKINRTILEDSVTEETLQLIYTEIDQAAGVIADTELLFNLVEAGILSPETAAVQAGFDPSEAEKAFEAKVRAASEIAIAQSEANANAQAGSGNNPAARGVKTLSPNPKMDARMEKKKNG